MDPRIDVRPLDETAGRPFQIAVDSPHAPPLSTILIEAVIAAIGEEALSREPPLYDVVDPDALDTLFAATELDKHPDFSVAFEYAGCEVSIRPVDRVPVRS
jgi:hypothetical protein